MIGEKIKVLLGDEIECYVYILCTPDMTNLEKLQKAFDKLKDAVEQREKVVTSLKEKGFDFTK